MRIPFGILTRISPFIACTSLFLAACGVGDQGVKAVNAVPTAKITSHADGDTVIEGESITVRGTGADPDDDPEGLSATWLADGVEIDGCVGQPVDEFGVTSCSFGVGADLGAVSLEIHDPSNGLGEDDVNLEVVNTDAPVAEITSPVSTGVYYSDQLVALEGLIRDTEDDPTALTVVWESSLDGPLGGGADQPDSSGLLAGATFLTEGNQEISLTVTDSSGKTGRDSISIQVGPPNSAPDCSFVAPENGTAGAEGLSVVMEGEVSDPDVAPDWLLVTWESDKDGELGTSPPDTDGTVSFATGDLSVNTHNLSLTVTDEVGAICTASVLYTVGTPPELDVTEPVTGDVVNEGELVLFAATVSDGEDIPTAIALSWESDVDGLFSTEGADSTGVISFSESGFSPGDHIITIRATDTAGLYAQEVINIRVNEVPTEPSLTLSPDPAYTDDAIIATASGSLDPDLSGTVTYGYAWYVGGVSSGASSSATLPASATIKGETWSVVVTPNDGIGDGPSATASLLILNSAPVLSGPTLSSSTVAVGDSLTCFASATDADGDSLSTSYTWTLSSGTVLGTSTTLSLTSGMTTPGDTLTCTVTVEDGDGGVDVGSASATVDNTLPVVGTVSVSPTTVDVGDTVTCTGSATDADGGTPSVSYAWTNGSTGATIGIGSSLLVTAGDTDPGDSLVCTVTATDSAGGTDTGSASATVQNSAPELSTVTVTPSTGGVGDTLSCSASATDADGGTPTLGYAWTDSTAGTSIGSGTTYTINATDTNPGDTLVCTVTATDVDGGVDTGSGSATVTNTAPVLTSVSVSPSTGQVGETLTCSGSATDADGGTPAVTYAWINTTAGTSLGTGSTYTITAAGTNPGDTLTCTVTATDTSGGTDIDSATATVVNSTPVFTSVSVSPSTGKVGDTLTCSGSATDPDGGTPTVTYAWTNSTSGGSLGSGSTYTIAASGTDPGDVLLCTATATDTSGATATGSATATVINTSPVVASVSISPTSAYNTDTLTCSSSVSDADGGTPTVTYSWADTTKGSTLGSSATMTLTTATASSLDTVACTVVATDSSSGTGTGTASLILGNREPTLSSGPSISPTSPKVGDTLTCTATGSDNDADTVTLSYAWSKGGSTMGTSSSYSGTLAKGETWTCTVTPDDGKGAGSGTAGSASVTVGNTLPVVASVSLSPTSPKTNDTITATASASDADGDSVTLTYSWYVNGSSVTSGTASTLSGVSWFKKNDSVYVVVTPADSTGSGTALASSAVTISNTAPTAPGVAISPTAPEEGADDLICDLTAASSDDDADSISYSVTWKLNGSTWTGATTTTVITGDTIDASLTNSGDVWTCTMTPSDGTVSGSSTTSSSVTVTSSLPDLIVDNTTYTLSSGSYEYDEVEVINGGTLYVSSTVIIEASSFYVEAGAKVSGDAKGSAGATATAGTGSGSGAGGGSSNSGGGGGGHGGAGGRGAYDSGDTVSTAGSTYGSTTNTTTEAGSGGGAGNTYDGGSGGAAISVSAADIIVDGTITMDGAAGAGPAGQNGGGGSGGGIVLIGDAVEITGTLSADGGAGGQGTNEANDDGGGGGGGIIKVFYDASIVKTGSYTVTGGSVGTHGDFNAVAGSTGATYQTYKAYP